MHLSYLISNIHWIPVIVMTIVSFALGAVWHQKFLFGKVWTIENKPTLDRKMNIPLVFGGTAVMHFLALTGLSALVSSQGWHDGLHIGFLVSVVWIFPAMAATYLFANRSKTADHRCRNVHRSVLTGRRNHGNLVILFFSDEIPCNA